MTVLMFMTALIVMSSFLRYANSSGNRWLGIIFAHKSFQKSTSVSSPICAVEILLYESNSFTSHPSGRHGSLIDGGLDPEDVLPPPVRLYHPRLPSLLLAASRSMMVSSSTSVRVRVEVDEILVYG